MADWQLPITATAQHCYRMLNHILWTQSKLTQAAWKMSVKLAVSLGDFESAPPVAFRLKYGPGPVHTCRQHLAAVEEDAEEEDDGDEHVKFLSITGK